MDMVQWPWTSRLRATITAMPSRVAAAIIALISLAALVLQYALLLHVAPAELGAGFLTVRFFSYFTVLSNLLVLVACLWCAIAGQDEGPGPGPAVRFRAATALFIGVTGTVYLLVLRHLWQPQGLQWWVDGALHYATPALYLLWWAFGTQHGSLRWPDAARWLVFPAAYLAWCLVRGSWVHEYPYPFIDVDALGGVVVARNATGVMAVFVLGAVLLLFLDRALSPRSAGAVRR